MGKNKNKNTMLGFKDNKKNDAIEVFKKQNQDIILSDERVQKIKERYENKEAELNIQQKQLDDEREMFILEKEAFEKEKNEFNSVKDNTIKELNEKSKEEISKAVELEMQRIKESEKEIRKDYNTELINECNKKCKELLDDAQKRAADIVADVQQKNDIIQKEYREIDLKKLDIINEANIQANEIIKKANEDALEILDSARMNTDALHKKYLDAQIACQNARSLAENDYRAAINDNAEEYNRKVLELKQKQKELDDKYEEFEMDKEDLQIERESIQILRQNLEERKEKYSPAAVEKLNEQLSIINQELEEYKKENKMQAERIRILSRYSNENDTENMESVMKDLNFYRKENIELHDQLAEYPTQRELADIRSKADRYDELLEQCREEQARRLDAEEKLEKNQIGIMELEQQKKISYTLRLLNDQLKAEIDRNNEIYNQTNSAKFPALCAIDNAMQDCEEYHGLPSNKTLEELVDYVRNYGAAIGDGRTKLYYSHSMIRSFIASMAASHLIILQGLSGTGKSSLPRLMKKALNFDNSLIPVQSSWNDNRELLGYDNDFTKRFKETEFTKAVYKASLKQNSDKISMIILDEMNLARIEYYFADFLAIMEKNPDDWYISLVNNNPESDPPVGLINGTDLKVSENIWFIGTANRDESTMGITDKVYDRALVLDFSERSEPFDATCKEKVKMSTSEFCQLIDAAIQTKSYQLNKNDLDNIEYIDNRMKEELEITFGNRIKMQMEKFVPVYCACGGTKEEAIDYLLRHKVLRKLDDRFEPYIISGLKNLKSCINDIYGDMVLVESNKYIDKVIRRLGDES